MSGFPKWEDFIEAKSENTPPQGKNAAPYHGPNAKNKDGVRIRVVEKPENPLGDEGVDIMKDRSKVMPMGQKPSYKGLVKENKMPKVPKPPKVAVKDNVSKPKLRVAEKGKGLADEATPALRNPKSNHPVGQKPSYDCLTTEQFINQTKNMSDSEFVQALMKEGLEGLDNDEDEMEPQGIQPVRCALTGKTAFPSAHETARYMARLLPENARARRLLINELKSVPGGMGALMGELVGHGETYQEMVNQIGLGETKVARRFVKAMQEDHEKFMQEMGLMTGGSFGLGEAVNVPMTQRMPPPRTPASMAAPTQATDPNDPFAPEPGQGDQSADTMMSDPAGDGTASVDQVPSDQAQQSPMAKLNKEFAYHHMVREMSKYPNMAEVMQEMLGGFNG